GWGGRGALSGGVGKCRVWLPPSQPPPASGGRGRSRGTLPHVHPLPPLAREGWGGGASAATRSGTPPPNLPPQAGGGAGVGALGRTPTPSPRSRGRVGVGAGRVRMPSPAPSTQKGRPKAAFPLQPGRAASARQALGDRRAQVARRLHRGHARLLQRGELALGRARTTRGDRARMAHPLALRRRGAGDER